jgi:hypothetical protein
MDKFKFEWKDRQTEGLTSGPTDRQIDRQADTQTNRRTNGKSCRFNKCCKVSKLEKDSFLQLPNEECFEL